MNQPVQHNPNLYYIETRVWGINDLDKKPMEMHSERTVTKFKFWFNAIQFWRFKRWRNSLNEREWWAKQRLELIRKNHFFAGFLDRFFSIDCLYLLYSEDEVEQYFYKDGFNNSI